MRQTVIFKSSPGRCCNRLRFLDRRYIEKSTFALTSTSTEVTDVSVTAVAQYYQLLSDATLTNTEVTDEHVTAFAQYCRLLSGVTLTNTEVTDVSATAVAQYYQLLSDATLTITAVTDESVTAFASIDVCCPASH